MPTSEKEIDRIGDIIKNARGTWFVLLGSLVFAAITLASVKDASFFIASEQTKLPLLGISVPITSFFWAGALLITALYTYLHLYLVQLWDALGEADARIGDKPLADVIHPWLVSDAALRVRDKRRGAKRKNPYAKKSGWKNRLQQFEWWLVTRTRKCWLGAKYRWLRGVQQFKYGKRSSSQRGMSKIGNLVSVLLVWVLGLTVVFGFWWRSMPAHSFVSNYWPFIGLTEWLGILLVWSLYVFWRSGSYALARLGGRERRFPAPILIVSCAGVITFFSFVRTHHDIWEGDPRISRSELTAASKMTKRLGLDGKWSRYALNFSQEFIRPARAEMSEVVFTQKPKDWKGFELAKQEFRLRWCKQMKNVVCAINPLQEKAQFEEEEEKEFERAWKEQWKAMLASFKKPDLRRRRMEGANLRLAELEGMKLHKARLQGAELTLAKMQGASLTKAQIQGADLRGAKMQGADLRGARMQGADLRGARMQGADLRGAQMQGTPEKMMKLQSTNLSEGNFSGVSLRFVEFTDAVVTKIRNFDKSFGDGSVNLAGGMIKPVGWCEAVLSDAQYWGRYRGWLEEHQLFGLFLPKIVEKYPPIPFSEPCPE